MLSLAQTRLCVVLYPLSHCPTPLCALALLYVNTSTWSCGRVNYTIQGCTDGWKSMFLLSLSWQHFAFFECLFISSRAYILYCNFRNAWASLIKLVRLMLLKCFQLNKGNAIIYHLNDCLQIWGYTFTIAKETWAHDIRIWVIHWIDIIFNIHGQESWSSGGFLIKACGCCGNV